MKYQFEFNGRVAKWEDIQAFYDKDQNLAIRMAPKLTEKHLHPNGFMKMKVKLASQVLSHSVAAGISTYVALNGLSGDALGTAAFLEQMDKIFDCCNSLSFKDPKPGRRPFSRLSPHHEVISDGIELFRSIKVIERSTGKDRTGQIKCLKGWEITLRSILQLWQGLYDQGIVSFLVTRQLNQDPLENFFGSIRQQGGNSDNPMPVQFKRADRKLFHNNLLTITTGNCEVDSDTPSLKLAIIDVNTITSNSKPNISPTN